MSTRVTLSYSDCARSTEYLSKREQAIVFPLIENITNEDYAEALGLLVPPNLKSFSSHVCHERECVFISTKLIPQISLWTNIKIVIKGEVRRFVNPLSNLVSNVCPILFRILLSLNN